jgi:hypothetical protein
VEKEGRVKGIKRDKPAALHTFFLWGKQFFLWGKNNLQLGVFTGEKQTKTIEKNNNLFRLEKTNILLLIYISK